MEDYYVEIFLGISIGAFVISLILLISFIRESLKLKTECKPVQVNNRDQSLPIEH